MRTGCVSNPKLRYISTEFHTSVYPPNCRSVRIYDNYQTNGYYLLMRRIKYTKRKYQNITATHTQQKGLAKVLSKVFLKVFSKVF